MQIGLIGKANVGKSTFFSAATSTPAASGNFPFTTIKPNVGVAHVRTGCACRHFGIEHEHELCRGGTRFVPVKLVDVAGLVPGAHEGRGLGNQFLDDARQADVLIHVVDAAGATDIEGRPVPPGTHDPLEDVAFVQDEFDRWFAGILERDWEKICREAAQKRAKTSEGIAHRFAGLGIKEFEVEAVLQRLGLASRDPADWGERDVAAAAAALRAGTKPMVVAANKADLCPDPGAAGGIAGGAVPCSSETELLLRKAADAGMIRYVPGAGDFEACGAGMQPAQERALDLARSVLSRMPSTGVQEALDSAVFGRLGFVVAYPVEDESRLADKGGRVLPDARLMPPGSTARDLAGTIHADIAAGFLHAIDCKTHQRIGGDHVLADGDVIKVVSTAGRG